MPHLKIKVSVITHQNTPGYKLMIDFAVVSFRHFGEERSEVVS